MRRNELPLIVCIVLMFALIITQYINLRHLHERADRAERSTAIMFQEVMHIECNRGPKLDNQYWHPCVVMLDVDNVGELIAVRKRALEDK